MGLIAASLGLGLGFLFKSKIFLIIVVCFFLFMALAMYGKFHLALPTKIQTHLSSLGGNSNRGAFIVGLTIGLIASPCVGPMVGPFLVIAAENANRWYGFALLLSYGLGMGVFFVILSNSFAKYVYRMKKILAFALLLPAAYYSYVLLAPYLGHSKTDHKTIWVYSIDQGLDLAKENKKPVLIDFYAEWCPPCKELDLKTFSDSRVKKFADKFVMIKIDCTEDDLNCEKASSMYNVIGFPTVIFLNAQGEALDHLKVLGGFIGPDKMLEKMENALE